MGTVLGGVGGGVGFGGGVGGGGRPGRGLLGGASAAHARLRLWRLLRRPLGRLIRAPLAGVLLVLLLFAGAAALWAHQHAPPPQTPQTPQTPPAPHASARPPFLPPERAPAPLPNEIVMDLPDHGLGDEDEEALLRRAARVRARLAALREGVGAELRREADLEAREAVLAARGAAGSADAAAARLEVVRGERDAAVEAVVRRVRAGGARATDAAAVLSDALRSFPDEVRLWELLGAQHQAASRWRDAANAFAEAFRAAPGRTDLARRAMDMYKKASVWGEVLVFARAVHALTPNLDTLIPVVRAAMKINAWETWDEDIPRMMAGVRARHAEGRFCMDVFTGMHFPFNITETNRMAELSARAFGGGMRVPGPRARAAGRALAHAPPLPGPDAVAAAVRGERRIRVGYLSSDFKTHPVGLVTQHAFGFHDRERFEAFCYYVFSGTPNRRDKVHLTVRENCEHFVEIGATRTAEAVARVRADGIDVLVDLNLYTMDHRTDIIAARPAPVTAVWLGLGTSSGADWIDYLIADVTTVPDGFERHYREAVVRMPHSYHIADHKLFYGEVVPASRAAHGIREDTFVFCNHQNVVRWDPATFAIWCSIVRRVPGSILALKLHSPYSVENLKRAAHTCGLVVNDTHPGAGQLIFVPPGSFQTHLATKGVCDLFLDTRWYNGHSTALDLLWAGVPLLAFPSQSLAGRAGASFARSVGTPEMVVGSWDEYEELAVALGRDRERYRAFDRRLHEARSTAPLFDTKRWVKNWENALEAIVARHAAGLLPESFVVPDTGPQLCPGQKLC